MKTVEISFMEKNDVQKAAEVLSRAMLANPLHVAILLGKGEQQRKEIETMFFELFCQLPGIVFLAKKEQRIVGVMRMNSCTGRTAPIVPEAPADETDVAWRKSVWQAEWARRDPVYQHWHLGPIGVLPEFQGSGIGSRLLERFCLEADACGSPAYLETDLDRNVRLYEKFGFKLCDETEIFGVPNRFMLRTCSGSNNT